MLLALQKAPSAKVVRNFSSLIDTLLEQYASKSSDNEQAMEEHVGTITLKYVEECFEACINHFSNDDENEKMDMATIQPFLNILNSNVRSNETYIPQNHALKCITSGFVIYCLIMVQRKYLKFYSLCSLQIKLLFRVLIFLKV